MVGLLRADGGVGEERADLIGRGTASSTRPSTTDRTTGGDPQPPLALGPRNSQAVRGRWPSRYRRCGGDSVALRCVPFRFVQWPTGRLESCCGTQIQTVKEDHQSHTGHSIDMP